jgi:hypothetical protein
VGLDPKPRAEVDIGAALVRRLLHEQHPDLVDLKESGIWNQESALGQVSGISPSASGLKPDV